MSLIKNSPGAEITNANITGNTQIGGNAIIDNQGKIEDSNIEQNTHIFPGGETWVDQYDERLHPPSRMAWLWSALVWCREKILAPIIIGLVLIGAGALVKCQQESQSHDQPKKQSQTK